MTPETASHATDLLPQQAASAAAIEADHVTKVFGSHKDGVVALNDVSVAIAENEFFTLLGPSGCGKTTLLRLIAGFEHATRGEVRLYGDDISHLPPYRRPVNTVFQSYALFPHMTVAQNIGFGLEMLGKPKAEVEATALEMLQLVRMETLKDRRTSQISGGQQQRVALARALAPRPKVLLLDEPLSALDLKLRKEMQIELKRLQHETGITFIFVTHDQEEALTMSDRVAVMRDGRILQVGTPRDIYDHPANRFVADFIGETNFLNAEVMSIKGSTADIKLKSHKALEVDWPADIEQHHNGAVTIVVRPEHATLSHDVANALYSGTLTNIVYFGTDTRYHVQLDGDDEFVVRRQNDPDHVDRFEEGQTVAISFRPDVAQVLKD